MELASNARVFKETLRKILVHFLHILTLKEVEKAYIYDKVLDHYSVTRGTTNSSYHCSNIIKMTCNIRTLNVGLANLV